MADDRGAPKLPEAEVTFKSDPRSLEGRNLEKVKLR